jgi:hypothetical protein
VVDFGCLAMLDVWCVDDGGSKRRADALVAEADAQNGDVHFFDELGVESKVRLSLWCSRAGRENNGVQGGQQLRLEGIPGSSLRQTMHELFWANKPLIPIELVETNDGYTPFRIGTAILIRLSALEQLEDVVGVRVVVINDQHLHGTHVRREASITRLESGFVEEHSATTATSMNSSAGF